MSAKYRLLRTLLLDFWPVYVNHFDYTSYISLLFLVFGKKIQQFILSRATYEIIMKIDLVFSLVNHSI